jgi:AcrR family transcriptional regulator
MVRAAMRLIRAHGVNATGMRDVVELADAPRGSLQHYFPGGKRQLVTEALGHSGEVAAGRVTRFAERLAEPTPGAVFAALVGEWRELYRRRGFVEGCPLAAATVDAAATSPELREAVHEALAGWQHRLEEVLAGLGVPVPRTRPLAALMISALEGALILARAHQDLTPLDDVVAELSPVLDSAVPTTGRAG